MKSNLCNSLCLAIWSLCFTLFPHPSWADNLKSINNSSSNKHIKTRISTQFNDAMITKDSTLPHSSIRELMLEVSTLEEQYVKLLDQGSNPTGLYLTGEYINNLSTDEYKYYRQIEWRLFNDGLLEDLRKEDKKALQNKLELLQLHRDMKDRLLADKLYNLYTYENTIRHQHNKQRTEILKSVLTQREIALESGFATTSDIMELRQAKNAAENNMLFYAERKRSLLPKELALILNKIESLQLKNNPTLQKEAQKNSTALEIQNVFTERTKFYPAWSDNLAVDLIFGQGKTYYLEDTDTYVGVKMEIPIFMDDRKDELIDLRQRIYRSQQKAISHRISQKIEKLSSEFSLYQHRIAARIEMLNVLQATNNSYEDEISNPLQHTDGDPERLKHSLQLRTIDTKFEVMQYRLKEYEIVLKIMAETGIKQIRDVFEPGQQYFQGH